MAGGMDRAHPHRLTVEGDPRASRWLLAVRMPPDPQTACRRSALDVTGFPTAEDLAAYVVRHRGAVVTEPELRSLDLGDDFGAVLHVVTGRLVVPGYRASDRR